MRAGSAAVAWAIGQARRETQDWRGFCLRFVRTCLGVPAKQASAKAAWDAVAPADRHHDDTPPPGVPVFWAVGRFGHVALSAGGGRVWSTDILRSGQVDLVSIATITRAWDADYLGWAETLNGVRVHTRPPVEAPPRVSLSRLVHAFRNDPHRGQGDGLHRGDVRPVERALVAEGLLDDRWAGDGTAGTRTVEAYARLQHRLGYTGDGANGIPGVRSLKWLGERHGFDVAP